MRTRAAIMWEHGKDWSVEEIDLDPPKESEVLVRLVGSGLCHSDEHVLTGDLPFPLPMIGGHEGAGVVEEVGSNVSWLRPGDHVVFGGARWRPDGLWYQPTLIEPHDNDAEIVQREVFGPVLTLQSFADDAEAVALANSTPYVLSAIVYTSSRERADAMGAALRAGTIWVNTFLVRDLTAPFGGIGISGLGREGGDYALDFYSDLKTYQVREGTTHG